MKNTMKKLVTLSLVCFGFSLALAQTIAFDKTTIDYGVITNGSDGQRYFNVRNSGDKPLIITKVKAACGCTTPEWSDEPILPGKSTKIKVGYDTSINGEFMRLIEVYSNDPDNGRSTLYIKGNVTPKKEENKANAARKTPVQARIKHS